MYQDFGPVVSNHRVTFRLFLPNNTLFTRGGNHQIAQLQVAGDFQSHIGGADWDSASAPTLTSADFRASFDPIRHFQEDSTGAVIGTLFSFTVPNDLPEGFYQYKYIVTFTDGTTRWVSDPCTKLTGSSRFENSAFVIGGNVTTVTPLSTRRSLKDLIIYEVMLDDITAEFRGSRSSVEAFHDRLPQ